MKTQREDNHLQANEAGFRRHNPADALILNLSSKTGRWYMSAVQTPRSDCLVKAALTNDYRCWRTRARTRHVGPCFWWGVFRVPGPQESEHTVSTQSVLVDLYTQNGMKAFEIKRLTFGKYRVAYWSWACRVLWAGVGGILACEYVVAWSWLREYNMFPSFLF